MVILSRLRRGLAPALCGGALALAGLASLGGATATARDRTAGAGPASAVRYLQSAPLTSGLYTAWAMLGLESAGVRPPGRMATYLAGHSGTDAGGLEREILAFAPTGHPDSRLVARLTGDVGRDGSVAHQTTLTAFAILALAGAGRRPPAASVRWMAAEQDRDGGYNYATRGARSDVDDTGAVLEALAAARTAGLGVPGESARIARAVAFIAHARNRDGGLPSQPGEPSNSQSTAWGIQGLIAVHRSVGPERAYLQARIRPDGAITYAKGEEITPVWVTGQALMGLEGRPLPLARLR